MIDTIRTLPFANMSQSYMNIAYEFENRLSSRIGS